MKYILLGLNENSATLQFMLEHFSIQSGIRIEAYYHKSVGSETVIYRCSNRINRKGLEHRRIDRVVIPDDFDKIIIIGTGFSLRQGLLDNGIDYKKIMMCYGDIDFCHSPLDEVFFIPKKMPPVPFRKGPAEIYQHYEGETKKSHERRLREGFFEKYCQGEGLDIGYGSDLIVPGCSGWDFRNGDAQYLADIDDESFDFVYSSHCLEHMYDVRISLKNWFRVVRPGGFLLLAIPHRDLYEKKNALPSRWAPEHKHMFLIGKSEPPDTLDIMEEIRESLDGYEIQYIKVCDEGHTITDPLKHSDGEYQIEIVIRKSMEPSR